MDRLPPFGFWSGLPLKEPSVNAILKERIGERVCALKTGHVESARVAVRRALKAIAVE
jgi:hypothetical protein